MNSFEQGFMDKLAELRKESGILSSAKAKARAYIKSLKNSEQWIKDGVKETKGSKRHLMAIDERARRAVGQSKRTLSGLSYNKTMAADGIRKGRMPEFNSEINKNRPLKKYPKIGFWDDLGLEKADIRHTLSGSGRLPYSRVRKDYDAYRATVRKAKPSQFERVFMKIIDGPKG